MTEAEIADPRTEVATSERAVPETVTAETRMRIITNGANLAIEEGVLRTVDTRDEIGTDLTNILAGLLCLDLYNFP